MTLEEKAKAYDEAIERAKIYYSTTDSVADTELIELIFPELKECEDERIRKALIDYFDDANKVDENPLQNYGIHTDKAIVWLKKQGEHANFRNKIQIGDKVTRNEDGVLVNLSQLKRVAKKDEKQGEHKPANSYCQENCKGFQQTGRCFCDGGCEAKREAEAIDKVEPKFKVGDEIKTKNEESLIITRIDRCGYWSEDLFICDFDNTDKWELVEQKPAEWSEEDIVAIDCAVDVLSRDLPSLAASIKRLKFLRPQNWTKEDKERYISCLQKLSTGNPEQPETINSKWFKEHVYPQSTWKPSNQELAAMLTAIGDEKQKGSDVANELQNIYQQLKKLKE